ncbi:hypothetical protein ACFOZ0_28145 [Streptomyces yaanensis]|uniref:Uncharacterized protein n=1 Tax=Streptomyces yaanensis TaxID=1142239 RepID=A0ABV7SJE9_9ACTN|nr:hypothetical protein [Streptomyces sp. CGMCC 4.7035]WNC00318.1 hypothetical protein Q2K21_20855 [Streptomyces sp. CGMCC 4.7035]
MCGERGPAPFAFRVIAVVAEEHPRCPSHNLMTAARARARVIGSGRALRLRVEAASLLDDLGHSVRIRFLAAA